MLTRIAFSAALLVNTANAAFAQDLSQARKRAETLVGKTCRATFPDEVVWLMEFGQIKHHPEKDGVRVRFKMSSYTRGIPDHNPTGVASILVLNSGPVTFHFSGGDELSSNGNFSNFQGTVPTYAGNHPRANLIC